MIKLCFPITITLVFVISQANSVNPENNKCQGSCATSNFLSPLPFPFGFSSSCPIQLNCNPTGVAIGQYHVLNITPTNIIINLPAQCDRRVTSLSVLYGENYAPSVSNNLLLQNCSKPLPSSCEVRPNFVERSSKIGLPCIARSNNISCFTSGDEGERLLSFEEVNNTGCQFVFSSMLVDSAKNSAVSLEWERVNLEWWIKGDCGCDKNAYCRHVKRGNSRVGFRCVCPELFEGDGFKQGSGCRRVDDACTSQYLYVQCGGLSVIGIVFAGTCLGSGLVLLLFRRKYSQNKLAKKFFEINGGFLLKQQLSSEGNIGQTKIFTLKEMEMATHHFNENRVLGKGGQGTVFRGKLMDGRIVAVKMSKIVDKDKIKEFINEIVILSQINHRNVVKLLGCCLETEVPLLVYEFVPNGTLSDYLHDQGNEFPMTWEMRVRVAAEAAGAISYLHSVASVPVYHRDIKPTNILLDEKYRAKVSDFGTSKSIAIDQTHVTTLVYGTIGYLDPEYFQTSQFTEKSDVYSFGVVLVELLTGKSPVSLARCGEDRSLATYFVACMEEDQLFDILDVRIMENVCAEEIDAVAELAKKCLNLNGKNRPTMKEVAMELERIRQPEKNSDSEEIKCGECDTEIDLQEISLILNTL